MTTKKQLLLTGLAKVGELSATHSDAGIRADIGEVLVKLTQIAESLPCEYEPEWMKVDYLTVREFIKDERAMRIIVFAERSKSFRDTKIGQCDQAGHALNRLAAALGIETPKKPAPRQMRQAALIERPAEVA